MLVMLSFPGAADQPPPLLQLQRLTDGGLLDRLTQHFQLLAAHDGEARTVRQPRDDSRIDENEDDEDSDERGDTTQGAPTDRPSKAAGDRASSRVNSAPRSVGHGEKADHQQLRAGRNDSTERGTTS
jgi:hypothetical protein